MTGLAVFAVLALLLLVLLLWLLRERADARRLPEGALKLPIEDLLPVHCRHFPQVRQALSPADREYLRERASPKIQRQWRAERRAVTQRFLAGLQEDFLRLERLGRMVAALAPQVSRKREFERVWLGLRFRVLYRVVRLQLVVGSISVPQLARLTDLIGSLAVQIQTAMATLEEASATPL